MPKKIKLEDLTLKQIRELKEGYQIRVAEALHAIRREFEGRYDCCDVDLTVYTDIRKFKTEQGERFAPSDITYDIKIKFLKEDD